MISVAVDPVSSKFTTTGQEIKMHGFFSEWYCAQNQDVRMAIESHAMPSAADHYYTSGVVEGRHKNNFEKILSTVGYDDEPLFSDQCFVSESGHIVFIGWTSIEADSNTQVHVCGGISSVFADASHIRPFRRVDVEQAHPELDRSKQYGFFVFLPTGLNVSQFGNEVSIELVIGDRVRKGKVAPKRMSSRGLLNLILGFINQKLAIGSYWGGHYDFAAGAMSEFARDLFADTIRLPSASASIRKFGPEPKGDVEYSHIIVLYKKCDLLTLQLSLFAESALSTTKNIEFLIAANGMEIAADVHKMIELFLLKYTMNISVVVIPDNVGFGEANNICARAASGKYLLITNPDVFPLDDQLYRDLDTVIAESQPGDIFGGWLYYADGSVMHVGMVVEFDEEVSRQGQSISLPRVVHEYKGYSDELLSQMLGRRSARIVQAITGAWQVIARSDFIRIGGFSNDFIFGHYEDADLCIRATADGCRIIVDSRLRLWHLEGKGSESHSPEGLGAQIVNRFTFSERLSARQ